MIKIMILVFTLIMYIVSIVIIKDKKKKISKFITSINNAYIKMGKSSGKIVNVLLAIVVIFIFLRIAIQSYLNIIAKTNEVISIETIFLTILLLLFTSGFMYFLFGIPLMVLCSVEKLINEIKNTKISNQFMISFLILFFYFFFLVIGKAEMIGLGVFIMGGLFISYIININLLIKVILNPFCFFTTDENEKNRDKRQVLTVTLTAAFLLLILVILNLFLVVLMIWSIWPNSYYCSVPGASISEFDLFYYTVVSFTTIGYGDIVPSIIQSKIAAVLIAFTSVLCLVIFVGSALSAKDKLYQNNPED